MRSKAIYSLYFDDCYVHSFFIACRVRPKLSCLRDAAPLLDLDRDERKLDAFLQLHKSDLQVSDLRIFLPFTINLDPYLRKVLKGTYRIFISLLAMHSFFVHYRGSTSDGRR